MENKFTKEQLHTFDKDILVTMILHQQDSLFEMNKKLDLLLEQIRISNQSRFGHSSEKVELQKPRLRLLMLTGSLSRQLSR